MDRIRTVAFFFCRRMFKSTSFPPLSQIDASSQMTVTEACAIIDPRGVQTTPHVMLLLIPFFPDKMFPGKMCTDFPNSTPQFIFLGQCHFCAKNIFTNRCVHSDSKTNPISVVHTTAHLNTDNGDLLWVVAW